MIQIIHGLKLWSISYYVYFYHRWAFLMVMIRRANLADCNAIRTVFYRSIMAIRVTDYTQAHLNAWAGKHDAVRLWENKVEQQYFFVAERSGEILGFSSLDSHAWLDLLYVAPQAQGQAVAAKLLAQIELLASHLNYPEIWVDASVLARLFDNSRICVA